MKIKRVELREIRLPLVHFFDTSFGRTTTRRIVLVRVEANGLTGWGEVSAGGEPFYSHEEPETAWHILKDYLIPWSLKKEWACASDIALRFDPIRGHNMAKAALENALWDIEAQQKRVPLARLVGGTLAEIPCGVSIGIQNSVEELVEKIQRELAHKGLRDFRTDKETSFRSFAELCVTRQIITAIKTATRFKHAPLNTYVSFSHTPAGQDGDGDCTLGDALPGPVRRRNQLGVIGRHVLVEKLGRNHRGRSRSAAHFHHVELGARHRLDVNHLAPV